MFELNSTSKKIIYNLNKPMWQGDLIPHKHGDENEGSTHFACAEMLENNAAKIINGGYVCCGCSGHECKVMTTAARNKWGRPVDGIIRNKIT